MKERKTVKNGFNVEVKVCCASCAFKKFKNEKERTCSLNDSVTGPTEYCDCWKMSDSLKNAGKGGGLIKKRSWFEYIAKEGKSDQSQRDFERIHGSIYINN